MDFTDGHGSNRIKSMMPLVSAGRKTTEIPPQKNRRGNGFLLKEDHVSDINESLRFPVVNLDP